MNHECEGSVDLLNENKLRLATIYYRAKTKKQLRPTRKLNFFLFCFCYITTSTFKLVIGEGGIFFSKKKNIQEKNMDYIKRGVLSKQNVFLTGGGWVPI